MPLQQVPKVQDGGLIGKAVNARFDPGKSAHSLAVAEGFSHEVRSADQFCGK